MNYWLKGWRKSALISLVMGAFLSCCKAFDNYLEVQSATGAHAYARMTQARADYLHESRNIQTEKAQWPSTLPVPISPADGPAWMPVKKAGGYAVWAIFQSLPINAFINTMQEVERLYFGFYSICVDMAKYAAKQAAHVALEQRKRYERWLSISSALSAVTAFWLLAALVAWAARRSSPDTR